MERDDTVYLIRRKANYVPSTMQKLVCLSAWTPTIISGTTDATRRRRTIRSMERDDTVYTTRRKANYTLSDGHQYWKAGQVRQCVDGAFCQPMPEEMVDRDMPSGPKYVALEQLADQARSIRPALKHVRAMRQREELDATGRIESLEALKADLAEHQAKVNAELSRLR